MLLKQIPAALLLLSATAIAENPSSQGQQHGPNAQNSLASSEAQIAPNLPNLQSRNAAREPNSASLAAPASSFAPAEESLGVIQVTGYQASSTQNAQENLDYQQPIASNQDLNKVEVVSGKHLQERGYNNFADALRRVPGVSLVGENAIDIRGQGEDAAGGVKTLIDGVEIHQMGGHGGRRVDSYVGIEEIDHIEVIPGGGSVEYGAGTRGGTINVITKGYTEDKLSIGSSIYDYGSTNHGGELNFGAAKSLGENFAITLDASVFDKDSYQDYNASHGHRINGKIYFKPNENHQFKLNLSNYRDRRAGSGNYVDGQTLYHGDRKSNTPPKDSAISTYRQPSAALEYQGKINDNLELESKIYGRQYKTTSGLSGRSGFTDTVTGANITGKYNYQEDSYIKGSYQYNHHNGETLYASGNVSIYEKDTNSLYLLGKHRFNPNFALAAGARYDKGKFVYDYPAGGKPVHTTGSTDDYLFEVKPTYNYSDTGEIYAKFVRCTQSPSPLNYRSFTRQNGVTTYFDNPDLDSEKFNSYEIGWSDDFAWGKANAALYHTVNNGEITNTNPQASGHCQSDPNCSGTHYMNLDKTTRTGLELGLEQNLLDGRLNLYENAQFISAKRKDGSNNRVPYVPKAQANLGAKYQINDNFAATADLTLRGKSQDSEGYDFNSYTLADIGLQYKNQAGLSINAGVNNLFDKRYYIDSNPPSPPMGMMTGNPYWTYLPGSGRQYYLNFKYEMK